MRDWHDRGGLQEAASCGYCGVIYVCRAIAARYARLSALCLAGRCASAPGYVLDRCAVCAHTPGEFLIKAAGIESKMVDGCHQYRTGNGIMRSINCVIQAQCPGYILFAPENKGEKPVFVFSIVLCHLLTSSTK